ncbi:helix-turn-helix domain-containing protein [Rhodococcus xishaensis]|uniref:XRE family transcriptional regulator n=1 Tax=Rhodococcus xishaensis TaxID=2487364 RepID=A0A3S3E032_9NOCA|nr:helix-turn-helix transcriptional regulator [Rhodococcus xishaensis]RVW02167.1 XRE family transcriptional regulator [Rhodococcus xishaensis]
MVRVPLTAEELERGQRLGELLRSARGEASMVQIALDAGISVETLRKIETGRIATPAFFTIAAVARVLDISLDRITAALDTGTDSPDRATRRAS